ncbi:MAG: cbb3-type cytochrome c oxidase subunit II [Verrucomicrobiia bacterium]
MKNGFWIFLAVFVALGGSWCGFVLAPELQLGGAKQTTILNSSDVYPVGRPGEATQGASVYRANGCATCHTEQVRQTGMTCGVTLTDAGKNPAAVTNLILSLTLTNLTKEDADKVANQITTVGGKTEIHMAATGPDIARGWGMRQSVAEDFLHDNPVQLGSLRAGPDLANAGARADANWQLLHLYAPKSVVKDSTMPPFRYLFEVRKIGREPSSNVLKLPPEFAPPAGYEVLPKPEAKELAAYLASLRANAPLYSAPISP